MGASLSVPCKSLKARNSMTEFLRAHLRPFTLVCAEAIEIREAFEVLRENDPNCRVLCALPSASSVYDPTRYVWAGNELSYGSGSSKVGFNFSTQGAMSIYMHAVLSWAALQVGRRRGLNELSMVGHSDQRVAYITYDSSPIPVLCEADMTDWIPESRQHGHSTWEVDQYGLRTFDITRYFRTEAYRHKEKALLDITTLEMHRLDALWKEWTHP